MHEHGSAWYDADVWQHGGRQGVAKSKPFLLLDGGEGLLPLCRFDIYRDLFTGILRYCNWDIDKHILQGVVAAVQGVQQSCVSMTVTS